MAKLTLNDAEDIARRNRPWTLRMECVDPATNTSKFWYATGRGRNEAVETAWGRIGSQPQFKLVSFDVFRDRVNEKLGKGYDYAHTGYIRMTPANLAKLGGRKPSAAPATPAPVAAPAPAPVVTPAPAAPAPVQPAGTKKFVPPPMGIPKPGLPTLDGPYALIVALHPIKDGFEGLDDDGDVVLDLTLKGGQDLAQDYGIPIVWTL